MQRWMNIAYNEAVDGMLANDGGPFGAVITKEKQIIASAHNMVLRTKDPSAHAEINAIRKASQKLNSFDLSECTLYTTCMPCPMCLGAIFWSRIKKVYYGASEDDASRAGFDDKLFYEMLDKKEHHLQLTQIDQEESATLFDMWNQKSDKERY